MLLICKYEVSRQTNFVRNNIDTMIIKWKPEQKHSRRKRGGSRTIQMSQNTPLIIPLVLVILNNVVTTTGDILDTDPSPPSSPPHGSSDWDSPFGRSMYPPTDVRPCYTEEGSSVGVESVPQLPRLDEQFEARVEAKILQKGYTVDVEEYYDYPNNRGMVRRMKGGVSSTWLYDFNDYESFLIIDKNCWLSDMRKEGFQFFNFTVGDHNGHIGGVTDLFNFGSQYNETFIGGNETVRGIPVNHWTSCIEWDRFSTVFQLDYYFSKPDYTTPVGKMQIPVRAVLRGQARGGHEAMHTFHHIYDFMFYRPGRIRDTTVFEVPHGTVCKHRKVDKRRPDLPDSFKMEVEMVQPQDEVISLRKYYYDYNLKLSRYDLRPNSKSMVSWGESYGYRPITLIHDYNRGIQYVIDTISRNCSKSSLTMDTVDADPRMTDPSHVIMRHGRELFDLDELNFSYQGKRQYREINCQVWAALRINWPQEGTNTTVEVYFNKSNWTIEDGGNQPDIVGLWLTLVDSTDNYVSEWINHIFSYSSGDPDLVMFDVCDCYSDKEKLEVTFQLKVSYRDLVRRGIMFIQQALQVQTAEVARLQPLRVTNIRFEDTGTVNTIVTLTLLEEANLEDDTLKPVTVVSATDGYQSLLERTDSDMGLSIMVPYIDQIQEFKVIPGSMLTVLANTKKSRMDQIQTHTGRQYSSGSMAVLGICMLLLGLAAGAGGMFFHKLKKRPIDIPYRVQD